MTKPQSFAEVWLGLSDPVWANIANLGFWFVLGIAVVLVTMAVLRWSRLRDTLIAAEYDEAVALRRSYVGDGGVVHRVGMPLGDAIYIVGIVALDKFVTLAVAALVIYAAVA